MDPRPVGPTTGPATDRPRGGGPSTTLALANDALSGAWFSVGSCKQAKVKVVGDFFLEAAEKAAGTYGVPRAVKEASDVIQDPEVDAVWICSPSQFHAAQIKEAAAAGKHIFCEKPIATNLEETV